MTFKTLMTNFGNTPVYEGPSLEAAKAAAVKAGFESIIMAGNDIVLIFSTITGFYAPL